MNRSKAIGTATETAIVRYARDNGFGGSEPGTGAGRRVLTGALDQGDIWVCPGVLIEAKGGKTAETASDLQVAAWLAETETERINAGFAVGILVCKRPGHGPARAGQWWAWMTMRTLLQLDGAITAAHRSMLARKAAASIPVRVTLADALTMLRAAGYGDPLDKETR